MLFASLFFSSKIGNKVPILTFSFVFIINNLYTIESLILYYEIFCFDIILFNTLIILFNFC